MAPETLITAAPQILWPQESSDPAYVDAQQLNGQIPNEWLGRRALTDCDGVGTFTCPIGTCYTGLDGFIGCCSVSSCAARTTCIEYKPGRTIECDPNTGGCLSCKPAAPYCNTITNVLEDQYIMWCDSTATVETLSYVNLITSGSTATPPPAAVTSMSSVAASTLVPVTETLTMTSSISIGAVATSTPSSSISENALNSHAASSSKQSPIVTGSPSKPSSIPTSSSTLSAGAIAGIAIAGLAFLALVAFLVFWFCIRHKLLASHRFRGAGSVSEKYMRLFGNRKRHPGLWNEPLEQGPGVSQLDSKELSGKPKLVVVSEPPWSPASFESHRSSPELGVSPMSSGPASPPLSWHPRPSSLAVDITSSYQPYDPHIPRPVAELPASIMDSNELSTTITRPRESLAMQSSYLSAEMALADGYVESPSSAGIYEASGGAIVNHAELEGDGQQVSKQDLEREEVVHNQGLTDQQQRDGNLDQSLI